jgi:hypothetical protein
MLEQLTLNGAITLLTYLQYAQHNSDLLNAEAVVATLCEMLNQLNTQYPQIAAGYGWQQTTELARLPEESLAKAISQ